MVLKPQGPQGPQSRGWHLEMQQGEKGREGRGKKLEGEGGKWTGGEVKAREVRGGEGKGEAAHSLVLRMAAQHLVL